VELALQSAKAYAAEQCQGSGVVVGFSRQFRPIVVCEDLAYGSPLHLY
jgi:hypothetical protein